MISFLALLTLSVRLCRKLVCTFFFCLRCLRLPWRNALVMFHFPAVQSLSACSCCIFVCGLVATEDRNIKAIHDPNCCSCGQNLYLRPATRLDRTGQRDTLLDDSLYTKQWQAYRRK